MFELMKRNTSEIDELDLKIMQELVLDSDRSYRDLAKSVAMSPSALIERVKRLEEKGYITGYGARVNYQDLGFEYMAVVEISFSGKDISKVEERIAKIPHVAAVWDTTGEYDALAVVMCKTRGELSIVIKKILSMEDVRKTNTNIVLNVVKRLTEFEEV
jgi:Lrp/AsnC family transcriptional regulator, leucine-responsive regulatory protein